MAARLAGDEFVVICPETSTDGLEALASSLEERLRQASIKASIGCGEREAADVDPQDLVERADAAMYRRKQSGGGRKERRGSRRARTKPLAGLAAAE
jgi:diguanylate cyclase (GGDEF)-like protein